MNRAAEPSIGAMRRIILRNHQSPGDIVMLTAAVRDLKRALGDAAAVDLRTLWPALWENNPSAGASL